MEERGLEEKRKKGIISKEGIGMEGRNQNERKEGFRMEERKQNEMKEEIRMEERKYMQNEMKVGNRMKGRKEYARRPMRL